MGNVTILPSRKRLEVNDKLSETIYYFDGEFYERLVKSNKKTQIIEKANHKKFGDIVTTVGLSLINDYTDTKPLNQFDRAVFAACMSEWEIGNRYTTPNIIFRHLTGKTKSNENPEPNQENAILESIRKLMFTGISIDMSDTSEMLRYKNCSQLIRTNPILPVMYDSTTYINGQQGITIHFLAEAPILTVAKAKKQLLTYDVKLLNVPRQHNSIETIAVKNYVLHRVVEIESHKLTPTIRFEDVFEKCRLMDSSRKKKMDTRKVITDLMEHLKNNDAILDYEVQKEGNKFNAITFDYQKRAKQ